MLGLETSIGREQRISTSLLQHLLSIIVPMHLGKPVGSMDPLLVDMGHRWAGDIKNVVAVGHTDGLTTDKTKLTKSFTWIWISVVGSYNSVVVLINISLLLLLNISLVIITGAYNTISWRGFVCHYIPDGSKFGDLPPLS